VDLLIFFAVGRLLAEWVSFRLAEHGCDTVVFLVASCDLKLTRSRVDVLPGSWQRRNVRLW